MKLIPFPARAGKAAWLIVFVLFAIPSTARCQQGSQMGSNSFASLVHDYGSVLEATSTGSTGGHQAQVSLGQVSTGFVATGNRGSPGEYRAFGCVYLVDPATIQRVPMLFAVDPPQGPKAGGDRVTLYGAFLNSAAGQFPSIWIDTLPVLSLQIIDDARIQLDLPSGTDPTTLNPKGPVRLRYVTGFTFRDVHEAYSYLPALAGPTSVPIDSEFTMVMTDADQDRFMAVWVGIFPTLIPLPPFGSVVNLPQIPLIPSTLVPDGNLSLHVTLPNDTGLVGAQVIVQGLSIDAHAVPLQGSFTNPLTIDFTL